MSRHGSRFGADTPIFVGGISGATGHNMSQPSGAFFCVAKEDGDNGEEKVLGPSGCKAS